MQVRNPAHTAIHPAEWTAVDSENTDLCEGGLLRSYLADTLSTRSIPAHVATHDIRLLAMMMDERVVAGAATGAGGVDPPLE